MKYKDLFFDLDRTLWDFDTNSREALTEMYVEYDLKVAGVDCAASFIEVYTGINAMLWKAYRMGNLRKQELRHLRFSKTLEHFGCSDRALGEQLGKMYISISPYKTALMPNALEVLDHLSSKYKLHIITNGFDEVQGIKMQRSGISKFFDVVITSEMASARKPSPEVFQLAMAKANASLSSSIMIGDDLDTDIAGARNLGMDQVYFNPEEKTHNDAVTFEIKDLNQLRQLL